MADARRFPRLELPFALVGAAGGFLSIELLSSPRIHVVMRELAPTAAIFGALVAALVGVIARKMCTGRKYAYEMDVDASARASSDLAVVHAIVILTAGTIVGGAVGATCPFSDAVATGALNGFACSIVFLPVAFAVLRSARAAQRARLGTLVARADYRAVWAVLATAVALTTLEALPNWLARSEGYGAAAIACVCAAIVLVVFALDARASRRAGVTLAALSTPSPLSDEAPTVIDLGLGDDLGARVERGASAYRDRDHTVALVRGDAVLVRSAMTKALLRGRVCLPLVLGVIALHAAAAIAGR